jgi:uncharacterized protein (TIGR02453 family)
MATPAPPRFSPATIAFLRALRRHNDREWFRARQDVYERDVRGPMVAVVTRLAVDFPRFAPDLIAAPKVSIFRPYRDTRFSADKKPLKTFVSAVFPCRGLARHEGAGLYLEVTSEYVLVAGGLHAPRPPELRSVRAHLAEHHVQFRAIVESPAFRRAFGPLSGDALQRVPHGFPADHPAGEYLKLRQFVAGREYPAAFSASRRFYPTVVRLFEQLAPLVRFLNEPLLAAARPVDPITVRRDVWLKT